MMMTMMDSSMAVRFASGANFCCSTCFPYYRSMWCPEDVVGGVHIGSRRAFELPWNRYQRSNGGFLTRRENLLKNRIQAAAKGDSSSSSEPLKLNGRPQYHPFEDIGDSTVQDSGDARLTAAETSRTIIEVNSKATLLFSGLASNEVHENILWPELPYITDEHGNIYFQVDGDEDILQTLTSQDNFLHVIIGFDTMEMLNEMELSGPSEIEFGIEEIEDDDTDAEDDDDEDEDGDSEDDDYDQDWVSVIDDEVDEDSSDESLGDWAQLETMRFSHPMYFAKKMSEVASENPIDWMVRPPVGLAIQGLLRPALIEEHSVIQRHKSGLGSTNAADRIQVRKDVKDKQDDLGSVNGQKNKSGSSENGATWAEEVEKDENARNGTSFYKLEMIKIQLLSAHGHPISVDVEDYSKAQPDAIAHSVAKIISRLKDGGEKTTQALKSLCWRCKDIQVEEATLIGVDSLGIDLRVCSGTQVQTLRFSFNTQATSEYSVERQLNDLLFPRIQQTRKQMKNER